MMNYYLMDYSDIILLTIFVLMDIDRLVLN